MILGLHDMAEALEHFWREQISADGGLWILALDGILLIPVIFAVFFYPMAVAIGVGVALVLLAVAWEIRHIARTHHAHWFWHR
jgi:hypothetical protein